MKPFKSVIRHRPPYPALDLGDASGLVRTAASRLRSGANSDGGRPRPHGTTGRRSRRSSTSCAPPPNGRARTMSPPGRTHRGVRPGRHALGRASHVHAGRLLPGARAGGGGEEAGAAERRAVQDRALRQPRGDGQALDARPREDPRRDADRHDGGGVQRRSEEVDGDGQGSSLEPPVHRACLSADARSPALPARQRLQDLHRDRRRPGLRARLRREGLRHSARAGGRHRGRNEIRLCQRRQAVPDQGAEAHPERQQRRQGRRVFT